MVYRILFYLVNFFLRIYYRKIHVIGTNNIPKNKPLFIVSNHPNGFMEPIMMACLFPIELHFLVRGDLFEKKALKPLLVSTNQIPIYRFRDGFASLRNNQKTILKTIDVLKGNNAVLIFAEGSTNGDWKLRPLKNGMSRMAFQCLDQNQDLDIQVVPVGVTFSKAYVPGSETIINVGQPFSVKQFYVKNAAEAKIKMDELSAKCYHEMQKLVLHLEDKKDEDTLRSTWQTLNVTRNQSFVPRITKENVSLFAELKTVAENLNQHQNVNKSDQKMSEILTTKTDNSHRLLAPVALIGYLLWLLPLSLGNWIVKKYVKQKEFISSVELASKGALGLIYFITVSLVFTFCVGWVDTLLLWLVMFTSGAVYLFYRERKQMTTL